MTDFKMILSLYNIGEKDVPLSRLSIGENLRSLAVYALELFKQQWSTLYFEMDNIIFVRKHLRHR